MEFPRLMYRTNASTHMGVNDEAERQAALKEGWFDTVPEALAGKADAPVGKPVPVTVYRKTGAQVEKHAAKDAEEAALFIAADGWHPTEAAAIAAAWPPADTIPAVMEDLGKAAPEAVTAYAVGLGLKIGKGEKLANTLARIETALLAGPGRA